ncbi:hypothetical protein Golomagni_06577, partial [Golovinomyces magnicellulatus]
LKRPSQQYNHNTPNFTMSNLKRRATEDASPDKTKKKKKSTKHSAEDELLDMELGLNTLLSRMDNQLLADYLAQKTSRFAPDLSNIELSDITISANCIKDATSFEETRTLDNLPAFLEKFTEEPESLKRAAKKKGCPHTLIVTGAGLRAADVVSWYVDGTIILTLLRVATNVLQFAKHMKVDEQVAFLKKTRTGLAVGTPARLTELINREALDTINIKRVIVDASHIDQKKRGITDMKDTLIPLVKFLTTSQLKDRYTDEKKTIDLLFY